MVAVLSKIQAMLFVSTEKISSRTTLQVCSLIPYTVKFFRNSISKQEYEPRGNGGFYMRGSWWYKDERTARAATFSVAAIEWEQNGVGSSARDLLREKKFILQESNIQGLL